MTVVRCSKVHRIYVLGGRGTCCSDPQSSTTTIPQHIVVEKEAKVDVVVLAISGIAALVPLLSALKAGKRVAIANKESLVCGGDLVKEALRQGGGELLPVDSEQSAIFQCLENGRREEVEKLILTASGGPFFRRPREELRGITPAEAVKHPTWSMGRKISLDSATLMNKGLEVIEAHHLFGMPYERINVVVQPQSAIHSMVEFTDGSVKAHLGTTDMRIPIQYALSYPERWDAPVAPLDFTQLGHLDFAAPDTETFRCLALARIAGQRGGTLPCAMNAANEVAVAAFLAGKGTYLGIAECVEAVMDAHDVCSVESIDQLMDVDAWARRAACANIR